jgi:hypothetical protein
MPRPAQLPGAFRYDLDLDGFPGDSFQPWFEGVGGWTDLPEEGRLVAGPLLPPFLTAGSRSASWSGGKYRCLLSELAHKPTIDSAADTSGSVLRPFDPGGGCVARARWIEGWVDGHRNCVDEPWGGRGVATGVSRVVFKLYECR